MKRIAGPLKFEKGKDLPQAILDVATVTLPFSATSFTSSKKPKGTFVSKEGLEVKGKTK